MIIGILVLNIIITAAYFLLFFKVQKIIFVDSFLQSKLVMARTIAGAIDGAVHARFTEYSASRIPEYRRYLAYLNRIKNTERYVTYLYTLIYRPANNDFVYGIDATILENDTIWVETEHFAFSMRRRGDGFSIEYNQRNYHDDFSIEFRGKALPVRSVRHADRTDFFIGDQSLFSIPSSGPLLAVTRGGLLSTEHREIESEISVEGGRMAVHFSFSAAGESESDPGSSFVDSQENIARYRRILAAGVDFVEMKPKVDNYGLSQSAFAMIRDADGAVTGLVVIDLYPREINAFELSMFKAGVLLYLALLVVTAILSLAFAQYFLYPLKRLSSGMMSVKNGDFNITVEIARDDEMGDLARGFNAMTRTISSYIEEHKRHEEELDWNANHDPVTGLLNRRACVDIIEFQINQSSRSQSPGNTAIVYIDLDHFKNINDTLGHQAGDIVLGMIASRFSGMLRKSDYVFRFGGDEFVVLLSFLAHDEDAAIVVKKLSCLLDSPVRVENRDVFITMSAGIAFFPNDGDNANQLLKNADTALYVAKKKRNCYEFFHPEMEERAREKIEVINDLHVAIDRGEFFLNYQPLFSGRGDLCAVEALIRWRHPEKGIIPPDRFIGCAEESGLIFPMGRWVIDTAWQQCVSWRKTLGIMVPVAVNLSVYQLRDPIFQFQLHELTDGPAFDAELFYFEITESVFSEERNIIEFLKQLHSKGVRFAIDDFGTGFSSLSRLKYFSADILKIDKSFIGGIPENSHSCSIVDSILSLGRGLGMRTVAEGVERREQFEYLRERGCDFYQGYYFAPPMMPEEIIPLIRRTVLAGTDN